MSAYPKARIEALGDGVFSVAMTLLALDVRFPDDFEPKSSAEFLAGAAALWPKFFPYALSFWVLGARWLALIQSRRADRDYAAGYGRLWLAYLFLVTCVPFTTIAVGRYASLAPAIWFYAGNLGLISLVYFVLIHYDRSANEARSIAAQRIATAIAVMSSLVVIGVSFVSPRNALYAFLLNFLTRPVIRHVLGPAVDRG
jgi:uncharacterized membrane protein